MSLHVPHSDFPKTNRGEHQSSFSLFLENVRGPERSAHLTLATRKVIFLLCRQGGACKQRQTPVWLVRVIQLPSWASFLVPAMTNLWFYKVFLNVRHINYQRWAKCTGESGGGGGEMKMCLQGPQVVIVAKSLPVCFFLGGREFSYLRKWLAYFPNQEQTWSTASRNSRLWDQPLWLLLTGPVLPSPQRWHPLGHWCFKGKLGEVSTQIP